MRFPFASVVLIPAVLLSCPTFCRALLSAPVWSHTKAAPDKNIPACISASVRLSAGSHFFRQPGEEKQYLDDFFSIMEETDVKPFTQGKLTNSRLVEFGVWYNCLNHPERLEVARYSNGRLPQHYVEEAVQEFFGQRVQHQAVPDVPFESAGGYLLSLHNEKETHGFAQLMRLQQIGSETYAADVNVYYSYSYWKFDIHAPAASWTKQGEDEPPVLNKRMRATLQKRTSDGHSRYILVDYKQVWSRQSK